MKLPDKKLMTRFPLHAHSRIIAQYITDAFTYVYTKFFVLLTETLPDALSSGCSKCNEKQRDVADKVINHLKSKRPRDWDRLIAKYDPQGEYKKRFEATQASRKN